MDDISRAFYEQSFELAFLKKKAAEFQDFFSSIMEKRYPGDFIRVRPWGKLGDRKNDGYLRSLRTLFQSYAPNVLTSADCITKIDDDFNGALPYWEAHFDIWVFVHNSPQGLGPEVTKKLLDLGSTHTSIQVTHWGFEELRQQAMQLDPIHLASLLGPAPSRQGLLDLALEDLSPVLDHIAALPAAPIPDLRPVPEDKLQRNLLSIHVQQLLTAGMSKADLVHSYFRSRPNKQDQVAENFRIRYRKLRESEISPDEIFASLQRYAGGAFPSPARQCSVLAVLAFFFEECDIFERPDVIQ